MKLTCSQKDFSEQLKIVCKIVTDRPTHPILSNVRVTTSVAQQKVFLVSTDLSKIVECGFLAKVEREGDAVLPAKLLSDIVSRLPDGELTLERKSDGDSASITGVSGSYKVQCLSAEEFVQCLRAEESPGFPEIKNSPTKVTLNSETLYAGLTTTLFAVSRDASKQILSGLHLVVNPETGCVEFAATDGHRLAVVRFASCDGICVEGSEDLVEATFPFKALAEVEQVVGKLPQEAQLEIVFDASQTTQTTAVTQAAFSCSDDYRLTTRTIEGTYPPYALLIPQQYTNNIRIDRRDLLSALKRIAVIAGRKNNIVKFEFDSNTNQLTLAVDAADIGSGNERLAARISGDSLEIAFNVKYVMESLENLQSMEIQFWMNNATSPVVITPLDDKDVTHLVMPVQVRE